MMLAKSLQSAAGNAAGEANYIESVFQTHLYTGNGSTQTITNGIDLAGEGGLVWLKARSTTGESALFDTDRGTGTLLTTSSTREARSETGFGAYLSDGFSFAGAGSTVAINFDGRTFASWTFRKQPKFFDVVTLTADGSGNATFSHNLGATPGCVILKRTDGISSWNVWHRGLTSTNFSIQLQSTAAQADNGFAWITPGSSTVSINGGYLGPSTQWVVYLFAHDAAGFGESGEENVISCGSYTGNGSIDGPVVDLGFEPQWVMIKQTDEARNWAMFDTMRGISTGGTDSLLYANTTGAEINTFNGLSVTATGFQLNTASGALVNASGGTYIYIAIRRGPMKVPESGTSVFSPALGNGSAPAFTTGFPVDMSIRGTDSGGNKETTSRLLSGTGMYTNTTDAEFPRATNVFDYMTAWSSSTNGSNVISWNFRRAPGFMDEVCYTGTGSVTTQAHNLGVAPEMMIVKSRSNGALGWYVYSTGLGPTKANLLNQTNGQFTSSTYWNNTAPTSSVFTLGSGGTNGSGNTQVAYLFATCPGVSKVGSYTGNGTTQTINCGFTGGSRFVLIKRTDADSDWYVWDSARGIVAGNDPYLLLNTTAAEVTGTDAVDTDSTGFVVNRLVSVDVNENGGTYIFLAIA